MLNIAQEGPGDITSSPKSNAATQAKRERSSLLRCTVPKEKMAGAPALLLLLTLGLCCPGIHGQRYEMKIRSATQPQMGQRLDLRCESSNEDSGVYWVHQDKAGTLRFIVFISSLSRTTFAGNTRTSKRFEAGKDSMFYWLVVKSFMPQDEGNYFCLININQVLYFSSGQPVFFPVTTTVAHTTPAPTIQRGITKRDPCLKTTDTETSKEKELDFLCDIFIWVPLTAACFLLLIALAITVILCQQTRRRRCRCKRPANGKPNVKRGTPGPHV
ncbi:LOW QUALITY PROTEIN: T-cell surface glycoprotein CD8 alpha chain [Strigops habroptila]|uniref:LOW QUALITY PROTEIN: T-cell surface glycoprotein CD8 alpha chain n=1 Tax=Strigops habroptila TaxID=2489341 RepID=UPI0011D00C73|nr:LOW QUALITY PROTEIN: T-cell surface glycoprotein CD8 alpha chain [Strigops habroptila]